MPNWLENIIRVLYLLILPVGGCLALVFMGPSSLWTWLIVVALFVVTIIIDNETGLCFAEHPMGATISTGAFLAFLLAYWIMPLIQQKFF
jgi:hypothetical protein